MVQIIREKNDELDKLEDNLSLLDFNKDREINKIVSESTEHIDSAHEDIENLRKEKQDKQNEIDKLNAYKEGGSGADAETLTKLQEQVEDWKDAHNQIGRDAREQTTKLQTRITELEDLGKKGLSKIKGLNNIITDTSAKLGINIATNPTELDNKLTNKRTKTNPDGTKTEVVETIKLSETSQDIWYLETWYKYLRDALNETGILTIKDDGTIGVGTAKNSSQAKNQATQLKEVKEEYEKIKGANIKLNDPTGDHTKDRKLIEDNNKVSETILNLLDNALNNVADTGSASKEASLEKTINDARGYLGIAGKLTTANLKEFKEAVSEAQVLKVQIRTAMDYGAADKIPNDWAARLKIKQDAIKTKVAGLLGVDETNLPANWETIDWGNTLTTRLTNRENQIRQALDLSEGFNLDTNWPNYQRNVNDKLKAKLGVGSGTDTFVPGINFDNALVLKSEVETKLGIGAGGYANIDTAMNGKTLQQLINDSNWRTGHACGGGGGCPSPADHANLTNAQNTITATETYLGLGTRRLTEVIDPTHPNHLTIPSYPTGNKVSLASLIRWYNENDKLFTVRANGLDIFDHDPVTRNVTGLNLDKIENYAKARNRLGLTNLDQATITGKLGTSNLNNIPAGKTLTTLLNDSNAHATCGGGACPNPAHHANYANLQADLNNKNTELQRIDNVLGGRKTDAELQALLDAVPTCQHTDYDTIKDERDTLKTENEELKGHECDCDSKVLAKEKEVVEKIITDLSLSTPKEQANALDAIITEIRNKITPPTFTKDIIKTELDKLSNSDRVEVVGETKPSEEIIEKVKEFISSELNGSIEESKLTEVKSYSELLALQNSMTKNKLESEQNEKKTATRMNWAFGTLSVASLLALAFMLYKMVKKGTDESLEVKK